MTKPKPPPLLLRLLRAAFWAIVILAVGLSVVRLEAERATVTSEHISLNQSPVTIYQARDGSHGPLIVVAHGFAGSRQMMQYISRDLARAGFVVAAFDFAGHGRNTERMSADVTSIDGTTQQLVDQTQRVTREVQSYLRREGDIAFVGHSMATDIVIRAADGLDDVSAIAAISMYSDAITATEPRKLLILSGAWEERLREVAQDAVRMVSPTAMEGQTVTDGHTIRRAVSVPKTEHVAVLFSPVTHEEIRVWMQASQPAGSNAGKEDAYALGGAILTVLIGGAALFWPARLLLPYHSVPSAPLNAGPYFVVLLLPAVLAGLATLVAPNSLFGIAGFGAVTVFFAIWGVAALLILAQFGRLPEQISVPGLSVLLLWGLGFFALALDRYAAAFLPIGPRLQVMAIMMIGTLPFMIADRLLVHKASLWRRVIARAVPITVLSIVMAVSPQEVGLLFTLLPVLVLFYVVYGLMGRAVSKRVGPTTAGVGQGIILAWAIASSTPLFMG